MTIPDFQTIMLPLLHFMSDGKVHSIREIVNGLSSVFDLTDEDLNELLPSGKQPLFYNRVGWARTYLSKAKLLDMSRHSHYVISERGKNVLSQNPIRVDINFLKQFSEFVEFREKSVRQIESTNGSNIDQIINTDSRTPEEILEDAYQDIRDNIIQEILVNIKSCAPSFFEQLVVDLLVKMGYGGSRKEAARVVGKVGDGGIDGIIDEDKLGLDAIYIQAKKWEGSVGRPEIQKFVGALSGKRARKGIFITSSTFSTEAQSYVSNIDYKIVLIDGQRLAELMFDHDIGVSEISKYSLKRIDSDYFGSLL